MVLVDEGTEVLVQGITGRQGAFHTKLMLQYGTKVVAGVTPGKGGTEVHGVPVYDSVEEAQGDVEADASVIFVPARFVYSATVEAITGCLDPIVVVTEHVPVHDTVRMVALAESFGVRIIGPNTPGVLVPGATKLGIMPDKYFKRGSTALVSRSGTLTYEIAWNMVQSGHGQSLVLGCGGDPVLGTNFIDIFELLRDDDSAQAVVVIGEIGGEDEEDLARYTMESSYPKPVVAYVAGRSAPPGKKMGHAGAIISAGRGTAESKIQAFKDAGIQVAMKPSEVPLLLDSLEAET